MSNTNTEPNPHLISYITLRQALGVLGIALPVVLPVGVWIAGGEFQPSISKYYYTNMVDVFVGILWAYGLFLFTYKGYSTSTFFLSDNTVTNIAGFFAVCAAIFPTKPVDSLTSPEWVATLHFISAGLFFAILGGISLFIFTQNPDPAANTRKRVYIASGLLMWACLVALIIYFLWFRNSWSAFIVYWLEAIMLWAFGFSWLMKGKAFK